MNNQKNKDYARVVYNDIEIPLTQYPKKLIGHLIAKYDLRSGQDRAADARDC